MRLSYLVGRLEVPSHDCQTHAVVNYTVDGIGALGLELTKDLLLTAFYLLHRV